MATSSNPAAGRSETLSVWAPAVAWAIALFLLSTPLFSADNTGKVIDPIMRWLIPYALPSTIALTHMLVRKAAHFTNYAILFWLLYRGPLRNRPYVAFGLCVLYAMTDEVHQIFVPGRTASIYDVALDSTGALFSRFLNAAIAELT